MSRRLIVVYGVGCGHCDRFKKESRPEMLRLLKEQGVRYNEFDADMRNPKTGIAAVDRKIESFPSFFVYDDSTGAVIGEVNTMNPKGIVEKSKSMIQKANPVTIGGFPLKNETMTYRFN